MNRFLYRLFIKDFDKTEDHTVRTKYGRLAGIVGILSNTLLCIGKMIAGFISGSVSIVADSINNLTDASSSLITLLGFKISSKPGDRKHPYGHARSEYIAGIIVAVFIIIAGIELIQSAIHKIIHPVNIQTDNIIIAILVVSIIVKIWQALFNMDVGKRINSITLKATAEDSRNDVISTSCVLLSIIITRYTGLQLDGYMGTAVALFIIISGIQLLKETISPLLGEAPDEELVDKICNIALSYDEVYGVHDLFIHNYGPGKTFASMHIEIDDSKDLISAHELADLIEYRIEDELNVEITAHMDPVKTSSSLQNSLYMLAVKLAEGFIGIYHVHDLRIIPDENITHIVFDVILTSECHHTLEEIREYFESEFKKINQNYRVTIKFDRDYSAQEK